MNKKPDRDSQPTAPEFIRFKAVQLFVNFYNNDISPDAKYQQLFKGADAAYCRRLVQSFMRYASDALPIIRRINNDNGVKIRYETACLMAVLLEHVIYQTPKHAAQSQYTLVMERLDRDRLLAFKSKVALIFNHNDIKPVYTPLELQFKEFFTPSQMAAIVKAHRTEPVYYFQHRNGRIRKVDKGVQITKDNFFIQGDCWVQDVAASLPVQLLGEVKGLQILDLCAAPGGKTMQLVARGAEVDALELNPKRSEMIKSNLERCKMKAHIIIADFFNIQPTKFYDAIVCDAPCSASGTARKNPDILQKTFEYQPFHTTQLAMLNHAKNFIDKNGVIIYCVCSVFPAETTDVIGQFLQANPNFSLEPIKFSQETEYTPDNIHADKMGYFQCLPSDTDGFFIVKLRKN